MASFTAACISTMRDASLSIVQGTTVPPTRLIPHVRRLTQGSNQHWEVTVTPAGNGDITIGLGSTFVCTDNGAMCTEDGKALAEPLPNKLVKGPP